jgi:hypothetical protein
MEFSFFYYYANDVNLMGDNTDTIKKTTEILIDASKEVGIEINVEQLSICCCRHQNAGQNRDIKIANRAYENVSQFKYLGMTVTNQNLIHEEFKRLDSGNACYHSLQNLASTACYGNSFALLSFGKNIVLNSMFSNTLSLCTFLNARTQIP